MEFFTKLIEDEKALVAGIIDNGAPVAQGTEDAIFEMFFTTKGAGEGTGLGLAVCRDVLRAHHGLVGFVTLRDGTKAFYFALPLRKDRDLADRSQAIAKKIASVLVAD